MDTNAQGPRSTSSSLSQGKRDLQTPIVPQSMQQSESEAPRDSQTPLARCSSFPKLGAFIYILLILSSLAVLFAFGFITFLWFASDKNVIWKLIAIHGWMTRAITISTAVLRSATSFQAAIASSMLAALALEHQAVLLKDLPAISSMRSNATPYVLFLPLIATVPSKLGRRIVIPLSVVLLCVLSLAMQFVSTILLSDVQFSWVPGWPVIANVSSELGSSNIFSIQSSSSKWRRNPAGYPMFAEWHVDNVADIRDGVSDTGPTLRAFLPFADGQTRSSVQSYSGRAAVLDSRTLCMRPSISNVTVEPYGLHTTFPTISLSVNIPDEFKHKPATIGTSWRFKPGTTKGSQVSCSTPIWLNYLDFYHPEDRLFSFCQLPIQLGSMVSEFFDLDSEIDMAGTNPDSTNYLAMDIEGPPESVDNNEGFDYFGIFGNGGPTRNETKGEWVHFFFNGTNLAGDLYEYRVSFSLCFASLDAFTVPVSVHSAKNRTEPAPSFKNGSYSFMDVRKQLGQDGSTHEERGIMELRPANWIAKGADSNGKIDYIQKSGKGMVSMNNVTQPCLTFQRYNDGSGANAASPDISQFVQEALKAGGRASFILQSLLTIIAGMSYYDQVPIFDIASQATRTTFTDTQIPGGEHTYLAKPAGFRTGYTIVMSMLAVHCILLAVISWFFFKHTRISSLHNVWQTAAQLQSPPVAAYFARATLAEDKEIKKWIDTEGYGKKLVGIELPVDEAGTIISGVRKRVVVQKSEDTISVKEEQPEAEQA
ncbi:hypothetical protein EJ08DRAFT_698180 [Tothia fuscella]|uniref:Uncharacterized protein n=1 Tax=Tothia fuscella TaxID=1048955 RepID=A0A9P4TYA3_9PEZI|nr:hypothetical protein EJ08DRAFT_698180 [Tothia fuscella]